MGQAYQDGWIVGDIGRCGLFGFLLFDKLDVLDIAPSKDDEVEFLL